MTEACGTLLIWKKKSVFIIFHWKVCLICSLIWLPFLVVPQSTDFFYVNSFPVLYRLILVLLVRLRKLLCSVFCSNKRPHLLPFGLHFPEPLMLISFHVLERNRSSKHETNNILFRTWDRWVSLSWMRNKSQKKTKITILQYSSLKFYHYHIER